MLFLQTPATAPLQVPLPHSASVPQVPAAQTFMLQVDPELRPVQLPFVVQLRMGGIQIPALGVPEHDPDPQSLAVLQSVEHVPVASPVQAAFAFRLVQSESNQQLFAVVSAQLPADSPLQVPTSQSLSSLHEAAEQVPIVTPPQPVPPMPAQSAVFKQPRLQLPSLPLQVRPEGQSAAE